MASGALIAAHDNEFNRAVLQDDAFYFKTAGEVLQMINTGEEAERARAMINNNLEKIKQQFNWPQITAGYEKYITDCYNKSAK
jgi:glycosyltransferase involved in cell wall biosynthesis